MIETAARCGYSRCRAELPAPGPQGGRRRSFCRDTRWEGDRKSTRLNSSHANISYAVFCLKKQKNRSLTWHLFLPSLARPGFLPTTPRSEDHTSELPSRHSLLLRLLHEKKQLTI